jgi:hypothetical protein
MDPAAPGYAFATGSLGLGIHDRRSRDLGLGFDPHAQLLSIDPDLDLMHPATLVRDPPFASVGDHRKVNSSDRQHVYSRLVSPGSATWVAAVPSRGQAAIFLSSYPDGQEEPHDYLVQI